MKRNKQNTVFIGRKDEIALFSKWDAEKQKSQLSALYGRRRIGKTSLVEAVAKSQNINFFKFEGLENHSEEEQKVNFILSMTEYFGKVSEEITFKSTWTEILKTLSKYLSKNPCIVLFDEFQWMANEDDALVGKLKLVWDNYFLKNNNVHLIVCGSVSSFIVKKVIQSKALYGRIDLAVKLPPLSLPVLASQFMSGRSVKEQLTYYLAVGGVPKYFEIYDNKQSVMLNIENLFFSSSGYFYQELERLFVSHFGRKKIYRDIIEILSKYPYLSRKDLLTKAKISSGGRSSEYLDDLELADFIEVYCPLDKINSRHYLRYRLSDYFLRFYFRFVFPIRNKITLKGLKIGQVISEQKFNIWQGLAFEFFCQQNATLLAAELGFGSVRYDYGSWYSREDLYNGNQIDLLFKRADQVITVCEVKFGKIQKAKIISEMQAKIKRLKESTLVGGKDFSYEPVLITLEDVPRSLTQEGYFSRIVRMEDCIYRL